MSDNGNENLEGITNVNPSQSVKPIFEGFYEPTSVEFNGVVTPQFSPELKQEEVVTNNTMQVDKPVYNEMPADLETNTVILNPVDIKAELEANNAVVKEAPVDLETNTVILNPADIKAELEANNAVVKEPPVDLETNTVILNPNEVKIQLEAMQAPVNNVVNPLEASIGAADSSVNVIKPQPVITPVDLGLGNNNETPNYNSLSSGVPLTNEVTNNEAVSNTLDSRNKGSNKKIIIVLIILAVVLAVGSGVYFFYQNMMNDPQTVFNNSVDYVSSAAVSFIEDYYVVNTAEDDYKFDANMYLDVREDPYEIISAFNDYSLSLEGMVSQTEESFYTQINLKNSDVTVLNGVIELLDGILYMDSDELVDNPLFYLVPDMEELEIDTTEELLSKEDAIYIIETIFDAYKNSIDMDKIVVSDTTIDYFGESTEVVKTTFVYDASSHEKFISAITTDEHLMEVLSSIYLIDEAVLIDNINNFEYDEEYDGVFDFTMYATDGILTKYIAYSLFEEYILITVDDENVSVVSSSSYFTINLDLVIQDEGFTYSLYVDDEDDALLSGSLSDNSFTLSSRYSYSNLYLELNLEYNTNSYTEDVIDSDLIFDVLIKDEDSTFLDFVFNADFSLEKSEYEANSGIDYDCAVDLESLTDSDYDSISERLNAILDDLSTL